MEVDRLSLKRTVAPHGLTSAELKRLNGAVHLMKRRVRIEGEIWWLTTPKGSTRESIANIQKRITRLQGGQEFHRYTVLVFETRPQLHAHMILIGNLEIARALRRSVFGRDCCVERADDVDGLVKRYLAKERTPQAGHLRSDLGGRLSGSHRIEGGGDRVRLSRELARDAVEAGLVDEWRRTNAKRSANRKPRRAQRLKSQKAPCLSGQIPLFNLPPVSRLKCFGGGYLPRPVAIEIEFLRHQRGWSQEELGRQIGRCQGHLANAFRGHDPMSAIAVNRLRDLLLNAEPWQRV